jgi:hypothetical protein
VSDLVVALLLLWPTTPPVPQQVPEPLWQALKRVALATEVVGPHERWANDFHSELLYVRRHWRELAEAPALDDSRRLPPPDLVLSSCRLNWSYQEYLKARRCVCRHHWDELTIALEETQRLYQFWELVREAGCAERSWACRRRALLRLRELLGPVAFYNADLPPCLPLWLFNELD